MKSQRPRAEESLHCIRWTQGRIGRAISERDQDLQHLSHPPQNVWWDGEKPIIIERVRVLKTISNKTVRPEEAYLNCRRLCSRRAFSPQRDSRHPLWCMATVALMIPTSFPTMTLIMMKQIRQDPPNTTLGRNPYGFSVSSPCSIAI